MHTSKGALACVIVHLFLSLSLCVQASSLENQTHSPFDSLNRKDNVVTPNKKREQILWKNDLLEETQNAGICIVKYNEGESEEITLHKNIPWSLGDTRVTLERCLCETSSTFRPMNMAYINISKKEKILFKGWIFSKLSEISVPTIKGNLFFLIKCHN